jgi:hypothetical protein
MPSLQEFFMYKKIIIALGCTILPLLPILSQAENCPSIDDIKQGIFNDWHPYNSDNGTILTANDLQRFQQDVASFYSIRWISEAPEGESHCYYLDHDGQETIAFFSRTDLLPDFSSGFWYYELREPKCMAGIKQCPFMQKPNG